MIHNYVSSIILVLYYLSMCIRASLSHVYRAARLSKRTCPIPSSDYIGCAARLTPFLVFGQAWVDDVFDWLKKLL